MNKEKAIKICICVLMALLVLLVVFANIGRHHDEPEPEETTTEVTETQPDEITVEKPRASEQTRTDSTATKATDVADTGTGLTPKAESTAETAKPSVGVKASKTTEPEKPDTPTESGGTEKPKEYTPDTGAETEAYIKNLELEGCPYCGRHDCPSFYATDEWGNPCYTPSKCPGYDVHHDPVHFCQTCGKPTGDGTGGTCVQFVEGCTCPKCDKWVSAWTCHTCEG